jgi:alcohol dehydrogenase class IV
VKTTEHDRAADSAVAFRHLTASFRVFAGPTALDSMDHELRRQRVSRVLVVTDPALVAERAVLARVEAAIGEALVARFADVAQHSPLPSVLAAVDLMVAEAVDGVVVVGGGSAVVTARAAAIIHAEQRDVRELCTRRDGSGRLISPKLQAPKAPAWVVPTTPTAAYAKAGAAVRDTSTGERLALFDPAARAQGVYFDPLAASTAPTGLVRSSSLNAFAMAVESLQANKHNPIADALLTHALTLIDENLPAVLRDPNDHDARLRLMTAALLAGHGTDAVGGGLAQALAHAIGPRSQAPNGVVEAVLLPHTLRFNDVDEPRRLDRIAAALGSRRETGWPSAAAVADLVAGRLDEYQVPQRLRDIVERRSDLYEAAEHAMGDWAITQVPRAVTLTDLHRLLEAAW